MRFAERMKFLLFGSPEPPAAQSGTAHLDPWMADPVREERVKRMASLLSDLEESEARPLIHGLVRRFARRVHDLPASESLHHRERWGLLDHSLEVAEVALRGSFGASFLESVAAHPEDREFRRPRLRYWSFAMGLLHELGTLLRLDVRKGLRAWNPLAEDLADFAAGGETPVVRWPADPAVLASELDWALFLGRFLTPPIARYLTAGLLSEVLDRHSPASQRIFELVRMADSRSIREDRIEQARQEERPSTDHPRLAYPASREDWTTLLARGFAEALEGKGFTANSVGGDFWVSRDYVALRYPSGARKLAAIVRKQMVPALRLSRKLAVAEAGARELVHELVRHGLIFCDPATHLWRAEISVARGPHAETAPAVLIRRSFPIAEGRSGAEVGPFAGEMSFSRPVDGSNLAISGINSKPPRPRTSSPSPPKTLPGPAAKLALPAPAPPLRPGPEPPPPGTLDPEVFLLDLRKALLDGIIPSNEWNAPVYVLEEWSYLVVPNTFKRLALTGRYPLDPGRQWGQFMVAFSRLEGVRKHGAGADLARIRLREGAKFCTAVVLETRRLFPAQADRDRVGYWTKSELSEEPRPERPIAAGGRVAVRA